MQPRLVNASRCVIAGLLTTVLGSVAAAQAQPSTQVDLELVVTVDVSSPMDRDEQVVARNGYVDAFRSPDFINAILQGATGRIAVTYVEFSDTQTVVVPWTVIDSAASANAFADRLSAAPPQFLRTTSISGDLMFSANLFDSSGVISPRRTIDVSGNGPNNDGIPVVTARDAVVAKGITINGLPIDLGPREAVIADLADYYKECVIGGPEAFLYSVNTIEDLPAAIRRKLVQEMAASQPTPLSMFVRVQAPAVDCMIGEKMGPYYSTVPAQLLPIAKPSQAVAVRRSTQRRPLRPSRPRHRATCRRMGPSSHQPPRRVPSGRPSAQLHRRSQRRLKVAGRPQTPGTRRCGFVPPAVLDRDIRRPCRRLPAPRPSACRGSRSWRRPPEGS